VSLARSGARRGTDPDFFARFESMAMPGPMEIGEICDIALNADGLQLLRSAKESIARG